jgi:hypothetical protein
MPLYEADLDKLAVEVKSVSKSFKKKRAAKDEPAESVEPKQKAPRKKKVKVVKVEEPVEEVKEPVAEIKIEEPVPEIKVEPVAEIKVDPEVKEPVAEPKQKKPRAPRKKRDPAEAPVWFAKYVEGVKREQSVIKNEKVPAKKVKEEAQEAAAKSWNHGLTRNRVQNEVDGHMSRMYCILLY